MTTTELIATDEFCIYHQIEQTFINDLQDAGLVQITIVNQQRFIRHDELPQLEKLTRMHRELDINVPGITSIVHLLERIEDMQQEMNALRNQLRRYEG